MATRQTGQSTYSAQYPHHTVGIETVTFADEMHEWLETAPWLAVSIVFHAVIALILMNLEWRTYEMKDNLILEASYEHDEIEPLPEEQLEEVTEKEFEEIDEVLEDPVVSDEYADIVTEELLDDSELPLAAPFEGSSVNDVIGIGGGGGGRSRFGGKYRRRAAHKGSARATQQAVELGLDWLRRHQDPEGFWDADGFDAQCVEVRCTGKGQALNDPGVTGLALLAFLGAGNTVFSGPYRDVVKRGVHYLCDIQNPDDGCLAPKEGTHWMYNHAIATLALTEAYGLSKWTILKKHAQRAVDFVHASRNPGRAWRYNNGEADPVDRNDVSVTGWMVMCLASAKDFELRYYREDMIAALDYIDDMTDRATGRTGYKERGSYSSREAGDDRIWPFEETEAMTAVAMLCRVFAGNMLGCMDRQIAPLDAGAKLLRHRLPEWNEEKGSIDFYYWYYGSYAMYQMAGKDWQGWKKAMETAIVEHQVLEDCARGSWDPQVDPWGDNGGRIYASALNTLCLEVFYRYDSVLGAR